MNGNAWWMEVI